MRALRSRWVVVLPGVGAVAMLSVMIFGWAQTRQSAELLLRGEADLLMERCHRALRAGNQFPGQQTLQQLVKDSATEGLLYAALVGRGGEVLAESGAAPAGFEVRTLRPSEPRRVGNAAWVLSRPLPAGPDFGPPGPPGPPPGPPGDAWREDGPPPGRAPRTAAMPGSASPEGPPPDGLMRRGPPPPGGPGMGPSVLIAFEPHLVIQLDRVANATLVAGIAGALALFALSLFASRLLRARDEAVERLADGRRLASLGTMSGVVAHELRNPLATLKGHAQLLVESLDEPRKKAQAQHVVDAAWRLEQLSTSLLELARTGAVTRTPVDPAALVQTALAAFDATRVRFEQTGTPARWSLDAARFQQVVKNLVENALTHSPPGALVEVRVTESARQLVFEVNDHGPGVALHERERIFEPFVTTQVRGVGLGLAISRQVVLLHGGTIEVLDAPGGGACFRVTIPPGA